MTINKSAYPTRAFAELAPSVRTAAIEAGQLGFVRMHERFRGVYTSEVNDRANKAWTTAMDRVDRAYGTCTCGDPDFINQCPSFDEHVLVCDFIDQMEEAGFSSANEGIRLSKDTVEMFTDTVVLGLNR
jgi:hypothetical protein